MTSVVSPRFSYAASRRARATFFIAAALTAAQPFVVATAHAQQTPAVAQPSAEQPSPEQPSAEQLATGRRHFDRGLVFLDVGDFNSALAEFQLSYQLSRRPSVLFNLGVTYRALHQYPQAGRALEQYLREAPDLSPERRAQVNRVLGEIRESIARVRVVGVPDGAEVRIDGERVGTAPLAGPLVVASGRHAIEVVASGYHAGSEWVLIAGGQEIEVRMHLRPIAPSEPPAPLPGVVTFRRVPRNARVEVDGQAVAPDVPVERAPGLHTVRVGADGFVPYEGSIELASGARRVVTPRLASAHGVGPVAFALVTAGALGFAGAAAGTAIATENLHREFLTLRLEGTENRSGPNEQRAIALGRQGALLRDATNGLIVCAGVSAVAAAIVATQTRFGARVSSVEITPAPLAAGVAVTVSARF